MKSIPKTKLVKQKNGCYALTNLTPKRLEIINAALVMYEENSYQDVGHNETKMTFSLIEKTRI